MQLLNCLVQLCHRYSVHLKRGILKVKLSDFYLKVQCRESIIIWWKISSPSKNWGSLFSLWAQRNHIAHVQPCKSHRQQQNVVKMTMTWQSSSKNCLLLSLSHSLTDSTTPFAYLLSCNNNNGAYDPKSVAGNNYPMINTTKTMAGSRKMKKKWPRMEEQTRRTMCTHPRSLSHIHKN